MKQIPIGLWVAGALITGSVGLLGQQPAASGNPPEPVISTTSKEVVLDVVVRDKKGKTVRDLEQSQVEVSDNGEPVKIVSFRLVEPAGEAKTGGATLDPLRQLRLVTLVFENLGQDGRLLARQAALDLIKGGPEQNVYYSVFTISQRLSALQAFTNDRDLLKKAINRATGGANTQFAEDSARVKDQLERALGAPSGANGQTQTEQVAGIANQGHDPSQRLMAQIMLAMLHFNQNVGAEQGGRASIFGLTSIVKEQYRLPGRKTVMYFTEGLWVPTNLDEAFRSMISAANRSNVSIYAVAAGGLGTESQNSASNDMLSGAAANSKDQVTSLGGDAVTADNVRVSETVQDSMRANTQNSLSELSQSTGGFLIANTNDLRAPLRKVNEDINSYYEISYVPDIKQYDGRLRKTAVKVARADVKVQARNGYFALPPNVGGNSGTLLPYEIPLLGALGATPLPHNFDFRSQAIRFQAGKDGIKSAVVVEVPLANIMFVEDKATNSYRARLSMVSLLKDAQGEVVQKFSRDLPLKGPLDKLAGVKAAFFTSKDHFMLPAGRYTLETAILDREADKVSARKSAFVVAMHPNGVSMSNIALVRKYDPKTAEPNSGDPFEYMGGKITPTLNDTIPSGKGSVVTMFMVVYPDSALTEKPSLQMEFLQDGNIVAKGDFDLPAADAAGRIPYVATVPAAAMKGQYEVRAVVKQGATTSEEHTFFTVAN